MLTALIRVCVPKIVSAFAFLASTLMESAMRRNAYEKHGIKSHFLRALSHNNDEIVFEWPAGESVWNSPFTENCDAHSKRIKSRILPSHAIVVVSAAAVTAYCYPNKITQNLISLLQNPKWLPRYVWCMSRSWQSWRTSHKNSSIFLREAESVKITHNISTSRKKIKTNTRKSSNDNGNRKKKRRQNDNGKKNEWESARETMTLNLLISEYYIRSEFILRWYELKRISFFANGITVKWGEQIFLPAKAVFVRNSWYSSFALCRQYEHRKSFRICVCIHFFGAAATTFAVVLRMYRKSGKEAPNTRVYEQWHTIWMCKVTTANGIPDHSELRAKPHWDGIASTLFGARI